MKHFLEVTFKLLASFTGRQGGIEHGIVEFGLAGMFWAVLVVLAFARQKDNTLPHEKILLIGFLLGFCRECFMMVMVALPAYGLYSADALHAIFPPIEHAIFDIALVVIAAGYVQYLLHDKLLSYRIIKIGSLLVSSVYLSSAFWWGRHILANPESKFGQTWCDWLFRINASILLFLAIVFFLRKTSGWKRNAVSTGLLFLFLNQFLKIPDMMLGEVYEHYFTPVRNGFYIFGIPVFGYIYIRELYEERKQAEKALKKAHDELELKITERTIDLNNELRERKFAETQLKQSEEKHRTWLESSPVCTKIVDLDFNLQYMSGAGVRGLNIDDITQFYGKPYPFDFYPESFNNLMTSNLNKVKKTGKTIEQEGSVNDINGNEIWFHSVLVPVYDDTDQLDYIMVASTDTTDRKIAEQSVSDSLNEKTVLLREIHHRVKNNMQVILSLLRMHQRKSGSKNLGTIFNDCRDRINAMSLIHESLYQSENLARIHFGDYLKKLCRNLERVYNTSQKKISLKIKQTDVTLDMDQGIAIGMVIAELVSNAFKHAFLENRGGSVIVSLSRLDDGSVKIIVKDDGKGLPSEIDILNSPSLGLKLAVAAVTRELGGSIDVERDNGTKFIIQFIINTHRKA